MMLGVTLIVEEAVLDRQMVGLPLTVEVGLSDAEAQKLLLCVPDTLTLDEEESETLAVEHGEGLPLCELLALTVPEAQKLLLSVGERVTLALALKELLRVPVTDPVALAELDWEMLAEGECVREVEVQGVGVGLEERLCVPEAQPEDDTEGETVRVALLHTDTLSVPLAEADTVCEGVMEGQGEGERDTLWLGDSVLDTLPHTVGETLRLAVEDSEEQGVGVRDSVPEGDPEALPLSDWVPLKEGVTVPVIVDVPQEESEVDTLALTDGVRVAVGQPVALEEGEPVGDAVGHMDTDSVPVMLPDTDRLGEMEGLEVGDWLPV